MSRREDILGQWEAIGPLDSETGALAAGSCPKDHPDTTTCDACDTVPSGPNAIMLRGCLICRAVIEPGGIVCDACAAQWRAEEAAFYAQPRYSRRRKARMQRAGTWFYAQRSPGRWRRP